MLKPSDIKITDNYPTEIAELEIAELEKLADAALRVAATSEHANAWPAPVNTQRMTLSRPAITEVMRRYRAAGWILGEADGCYFTLDHPDRGR